MRSGRRGAGKGAHDMSNGRVKKEADNNSNLLYKIASNDDWKWPIKWEYL